jgi:BolA protein
MSMQETIESKLKDTFDPIHLEVKNETHMHNVPPDAESHYKVTLVSAAFDGISLIKQHRAINAALKDEIPRIHALALHTYTPDQWFERTEKSPQSPPCLGGSNA